MHPRFAFNMYNAIMLIFRQEFTAGSLLLLSQVVPNILFAGRMIGIFQMSRMLLGQDLYKEVTVMALGGYKAMETFRFFHGKTPIWSFACACLCSQLHYSL